MDDANAYGVGISKTVSARSSRLRRVKQWLNSCQRQGEKSSCKFLRVIKTTMPITFQTNIYVIKSKPIINEKLKTTM
ncbi:hypothetical protein C7Y71_009275 [Pseudoprevotella muciniphila]|uniref:Uncharacterized protein n=1 Tax=Pseudoprevotella muciniphila TaxID=2133944 RepID=A0A5P8E834_9BACT|nr:hypothetical protein C7Y71_009275 [Pseudoprevotella muciniphila]